MIKLVGIRVNGFKQLRDVELRLPANGSVLIEGRNEAGKSTLFEAIYFALFGRPLLAGTAVDDLIAYQSTEAIVELELSVREAKFALQRRVRRTKTKSATDARLRVTDADGNQVEEVKGAASVNLRVQQELKLDADAFLNSCFVEQKKLEKLEGMTAKDRENSLMRLLNLDRMLEEEKTLKVTLEDNRKLQRLKDRVQLADVMAKIPQVQKRGRELQMALAIIGMKEGLDTLAASRAMLDEAEMRLKALEEPIGKLEARMQRIAALRQADSAAEIATVRLGKIDQALRDVSAVREQLAALERVECEELPALRERRRRMGVLRSQWARLRMLGQEAVEVAVAAKGARSRHDQWLAGHAAVADAEGRIEALAEPIAAVEERLRRVEALRAAIAEVEIAAVRLGNADQALADIASVEAELSELDRVEAVDLPELLEKRRRAAVLRSQWARIKRLQEEAQSLLAEAAGVRERLEKLGAAKDEISEWEGRIKADEERIGQMAAEETALAASERALNVRQALEDWQAASHARRSVNDLTRQAQDAQEAADAARAQSETARRKAEKLSTAARAQMITSLGSGGPGILLLALGLALGVVALTVVGVLLLTSGAVLFARRAGVAKEAASAMKAQAAADESERQAQTALVRLEGQLENARASQGAASGRLDAAMLRFEVLGEEAPKSADEAARRLSELPAVDSSESAETLRDRLAALRQEIAGAKGSLAEQRTALAVRQRAADAENATVLAASLDRLEGRAARITEVIVDHWAEMARARAGSLGISLNNDAEANRAAAGQAEAMLDAQIRVTRERLAGRPALHERIRQLENAADAERALVNASREALLQVRPEAAPLSSRAEAQALRSDLENEVAGLDEAAAQSERAHLLAERNKAESDRTGAVREMAKAAEGLHVSWDAAEPLLLKHAEDLDAHAARLNEKIIAPWSRIAAARAESLGVAVADDFEECHAAAMQAEAVLAADIRQKPQQLRERPVLQERLERAEKAIEADRRQIAALGEGIAPVFPLPAPLETREAAEALREGIAAEIEALNETGTRAELATLQEERGRAENDRFCGDRDAKATEQDLRARAEKLRLPPDIPLTPEALSEALPAWEGTDPSQHLALEEEMEVLRQENGYLQGSRNDIAARLGIDPNTEKLDPEKERADCEALSRDHRVREQAITILKTARERIIDKVLPYTIEHMRRILPALTMDRYHDAKLTSDYKIEVWDERASMWKSKNIFSGGTRDQFSLALRLAFAMATLPQERGAAPGFIFLDEPLSSFDVERSDALMYLLTRGEIADTFDQIFVISHSQAISADEFQHRMRLDAGKVVEASEDIQPIAPLELDLEAK